MLFDIPVRNKKGLLMKKGNQNPYLKSSKSQSVRGPPKQHFSWRPREWVCDCCDQCFNYI